MCTEFYYVILFLERLCTDLCYAKAVCTEFYYVKKKIGKALCRVLLCKKKKGMLCAEFYYVKAVYGDVLL
jgi:hypothetical protein